ncbi:MAG: pyridoxamine 5'-phosphate oxidase family protein [Pseudomonadales bacterium]
MDDALARFHQDRKRARDAGDPMAALCVLATVDGSGFPQARTLVLRDLHDRLALFMNATSPKVAQLQLGSAAICVYLPSIQIQYRCAVGLEAVDPVVVAESWHLRPPMPKTLDWFYTHVQPQSTRVASHDALHSQLGEFSLPDPLVAPHTAVGYYLTPTMIERLDLAMPTGLHDRIRWTRTSHGWQKDQLTP